MNCQLGFFKYQGAGNDFILIEDFEERLSNVPVKELCDRRFGIGADGLILARCSKRANFEMVFYNCDGSKGAMCGNGLRCFVHFLIDLGLIQPEYSIEVAGKILTVKFQQGKISTFLSAPKVLKWDVMFDERQVFVVDTGIVHAVVFVEDCVDVLSEQKRLRHDLRLHPEGVNVNFAKKLDGGALEIVTFEKGVDAQTLACGTGAAAAAFVAHQLNMTGPNVQIYPPSKQVLEVKLGEEVEVIGPSKKVFEGRLSI